MRRRLWLVSAAAVLCAAAAGCESRAQEQRLQALQEEARMTDRAMVKMLDQAEKLRAENEELKKKHREAGDKADDDEVAGAIRKWRADLSAALAQKQELLKTVEDLKAALAQREAEMTQMKKQMESLRAEIEKARDR